MKNKYKFIAVDIQNDFATDWVKCMNSPIWIRKNGGNSKKKPGLPFADSKKFSKWIKKNIGNREDTTPVIFGLTIDCCVLSTVQEFRWRGFNPIIIREAVDHASGKIEDRDIVLEKTALRWWGKTMNWEDFKKLIN
jgi:nicotinamidase-related amidase